MFHLIFENALNIAQADNKDLDSLMKICGTQLRQQGIKVGVFVVDGNQVYFKQGTREEIEI